MSTALEKKVTGVIETTRAERGVVRNARGVQTRAELEVFQGVTDARTKAVVAAAKTDAVMALAAHTMEAVTDLDRQRKRLAGSDEALHMLLFDVELAAASQAAMIQRQTFSRFGL